MFRFLPLASLLLACAPKPGLVEPLVTLEQASQPDVDLSSRGSAELSDGPSIRLNQPTNGASYTGTFEIDLRFEPGPSGVAPNMGSLRITYLKGFGFDLTDKLRPYLSGTKLVLSGATMPMGGRHSVQIYIEDADGNASQRAFTIEYAP